MTTYTIRPESADLVSSDPAALSSVYTLADIVTDAENFEVPLADYIDRCLIVHQDNPMDADELLAAAPMEALVNLMDDSIREAVHNALAPCSDREFLSAYLKYADLVVG